MSLASFNHHSNNSDQLPKVIYQEELNKLQVSGNSIQVKMNDFYFSLDNVMRRHLKRHQSIELKISLEKLNASTVKGLFDLFRSIRHFNQLGKHIDVVWTYEEGNDDIMETAFDFRELFDINMRVECIYNY